MKRSVEDCCYRRIFLPIDFFIFEKGGKRKTMSSAFFPFLFDLRVAIWNACDELQAIILKKNMGDSDGMPPTLRSSQKRSRKKNITLAHREKNTNTRINNKNQP